MSTTPDPRPVIVCVDDEEIVLKSLKRQLRSLFGAAFVYETAQSAEEGWEIIEDANDAGHRVTLILSDWLMPRVKGDEFLVAVHERFPDIAKVLLTGQADPASVERAKDDADLVACLAKPWSAEDLARVIRLAKARP